MIFLAKAGAPTYLRGMDMVRPLTRRSAKWLFAAAILLASTAASNAQPAPILDEAAKADVARVERYLNDITTLDSRFVQFSGQGIAEGRIILSRPGDMRIEYEPPVPVLMVASGVIMMYHDRDLVQTSYLPVSETPASFLLDEKIQLSDDVTITGFERGPASIRLTIIQSDSPDAGTVTLTFEDAPLRLVKWQVKDAQGNDVDVALLEPKFGVEVDEDLFSLIDPALEYPKEDGE
ncbi:MAG: outer membrane lipoprotein-sorting protein [Alphaproteobacteria bacterium]